MYVGGRLITANDTRVKLYNDSIDFNVFGDYRGKFTANHIAGKTWIIIYIYLSLFYYLYSSIYIFIAVFLTFIIKVKV